MIKLLSNNQRTLGLGISNHTEGSDVLTITGNTNISGIVTSRVGASVTYYGDGSNLTGITASQVGAIADIVTDTTPQLGGNLDLNSNNITGNGNISITGDLTLTDTDTGSSAGPELTLYRNSASPAPGDYLGQLMFKGENSNGGEENYAKITGKISDETLGTEDGLIETAIKGDGSFVIVSRQRSDELQLINGVGLSVDGTISGNLTGDVTGNITGVAATFSGDVSIGGTLTYEDVTNVDSVGLITARTGVRVTAGGIEVSNGGASVSGVVTATSFSGSLATTDLTGTITNTQLAGSIENSKLSNSTVSYGGVQLSLGGSDATPAFDLQDATNYPYTSLTGITTEILGDTTPQLGGDLDVNNNDITGTGNINLTGVITATSFSGDGSGLTGIAVTNLQFNNSSISIATTDGSILFKSNNVVVASISTEAAYWKVPLHLDNNKITNLAAPSSLADAANKDYVDNRVAGDFPTGDYGDLASGTTDAFGQVITNFTAFDCLVTPSGSLAETDLGALT